jgi:hypothetical protein
MRPICDDRVFKLNDKWACFCLCGKQSAFATKASALRMVNRGNCRHCCRSYKHTRGNVDGVYKRLDGKWCSTCSGCGVEQAYTRKDHAKQSQLRDWQCKPCVSKAKGFAANMPVGNERRYYNKCKKSAMSRGIFWELTLEDMIAKYDGKCSLTGWDISMNYDQNTASLDRIDSSKGYIKGNIQWVHTMVNMCKNKYNENTFIEMCCAVAKNKVKW